MKGEIAISIYYSKTTKQWRVKKNGKIFVAYNETNNGLYAKKMAELSDNTNIKYKNYITFDNENAYIHLFNKTYGYMDCIIDKDDYDHIKNHRWYIRKQANHFYCELTINGSKVKIHKLITHTGKDETIDHINRNGLDNRKVNLRITTTSINGRNSIGYPTNTTGFTGVSYSKIQGRFYVYWRDDKGKQATRTLYISENNTYKNCLQQAIVIRYENAIKYGYRFSENEIKIYNNAKKYVENIV